MQGLLRILKSPVQCPCTVRSGGQAKKFQIMKLKKGVWCGDRWLNDDPLKTASVMGLSDQGVFSWV